MQPNSYKITMYVKHLNLRVKILIKRLSKAIKFMARATALENPFSYTAFYLPTPIKNWLHPSPSL